MLLGRRSKPRLADLTARLTARHPERDDRQLDLQAFGGVTGGTMAGRRTKRSDGRFCLNITVENADGTKRRLYFYGRTQAEARAKLAAARQRVGRGEPVRDA